MNYHHNYCSNIRAHHQYYDHSQPFAAIVINIINQIKLQSINWALRE